MEHVQTWLTMSRECRAAGAFESARNALAKAKELAASHLRLRAGVLSAEERTALEVVLGTMEA